MVKQSTRSPFEVRGTLSVAESATVILVRQRDGVWETLMAESEVINWMKSSREKLVPMRYGGEWKLAGGNLDEGETPLEAGKRELEEEILSETNIPALPQDAVLRPLCVRQTRPIRSRSNMIYFFIAMEHENSWLERLDIEQANIGLANRRKRFKEMFLSGEYFTLPDSKKESISPEIHALAWMTITEAVDRCISSSTPGTWAGPFQKREYETWGITRQRDPMYLTGVVLREITKFSSYRELIDALGKAGDLKEQARKAQWLYPGMTNEEVQAAMREQEDGTRKSKL
eukprot:TRINITY_DN7618_c0_g1_i2.p1 TRINITY_DN7618_c0_g1~~TRINITY_DN7618_c0_g1_i2.p1  ORF type:complete len:287 (+),score=46.55 TRINITY_DN7618_c0_g1_i2:40-900(+)